MASGSSSNRTSFQDIFTNDSIDIGMDVSANEPPETSTSVPAKRICRRSSLGATPVSSKKTTSKSSASNTSTQGKKRSNESNISGAKNESVDYMDDLMNENHRERSELLDFEKIRNFASKERS